MSVRILAWTVTDEESGRRLDQALAQHIDHASRSQAKRWIEEGRVAVNGRKARPARPVHPGERIELALPPPEPAQPAPEPIPLPIVYEDDDLVVVDKPTGLVVHPAPGNRSHTLVNALLHHCTRLSGVGGVERPGIVHRLDRGTSGLLVVSKNDGAHRALARQFAERTVKKRYLALVHGSTPSRFHLDKPLGRDLRYRQRISSRSRRPRAAMTEVERLEELPLSTLVSVRILTGRTHQIRVHLSEAGHPVVGDGVYGRKVQPARGAKAWEGRASSLLLAFPRPALHSAELSFDHPADGRRVRFKAPLPEDLLYLLRELRGLRGPAAS
jgi:23S rRNA pseudouridine1911/1915/1917 synthase